MNGIVPKVSCAGTDDNICCICKNSTMLAAETCRHTETAVFTPRQGRPESPKPEQGCLKESSMWS